MNNRSEGIDALRGILIIFVVLGHFTHGSLHDFIFFSYAVILYAVRSAYIQRTDSREWLFCKKG